MHARILVLLLLARAASAFVSGTCRPTFALAATSEGPEWEALFPRLKAFYKENGHTRVTLKNSGGDEKLVKWTGSLRSKLRHQAKTGKTFIREEKARKLQAVEFPTEWSIRSQN